jgi:beta-D-galactosyl-(1->4)-L-rhamnose phosphorylase
LYTECAYYPESKILVVINNSDEKQISVIDTEFGKQTIDLEAYDTIILNLAD